MSGTVLAMAHQAAVLLGEETTYGTAVARTLSLPAFNDSMQVDEGWEISGAMRSDVHESVASRGPRTVNGGLSVAPDAVALGRVLRGLFGNRSSAELVGKPTDLAGSAAAGGTLTAGAYRYKVSALVQNDADGTLRVLNPSSEVTVTTATTNLTASLTWTPAASLPTGYTLRRYVIWRSAIGGAADSQKWLAVTADTTAAYSDTGSVSLDTEISVVAAVYRHAHKRTGDLASFTMEILKANGKSKLYPGTMFNSLSCNIQNEGIMTFDLDGISRDCTIAASGVPAFSLAADPFMGHATNVFLQDVGETPVAFLKATSLQFQVNNKANPRRWLSNSRLINKIKFGRQEVTATFVHELADTDLDLTQDVLDGLEASVKSETYANPIAAWEKVVSGLGTVYPWAYQIHAEFPRSKLMTVTAPSSGEDPILQTIGLRPLKDTTLACPVLVTLDNLTASYS